MLRGFLLIALVAVFVMPLYLHAATLKQTLDVSIERAGVLVEGEKTFTVVFSVTNKDTKSATLRYGVRIQNMQGELVQEIPLLVERFIDAKTTIDERFDVTPRIVEGEYEIFVVAKSVLGAVQAVSFAGDVLLKGVKEDIAKTALRLTECSVVDASTSSFSCGVSGVSNSPSIQHTFHYRLYNGTVYGELIKEGVITAERGQDDLFALKLPFPKLASGQYEVVFAFQTEEGELHPKEITKRFLIEGNWSRLDGVSSIVSDDNVLEAAIYVKSSHEEKNRAFAWWVLSKENDVCDEGVLLFEKLVPRSYSIIAPLDSGCIDPTLVGVLYTKGEYGSQVIYDTYGVADFESLLKQSDENGNSYFNIMISALSIFVSIAVIVLFGVYGRKFLGKKSALSILIVLIIGVPYAIVNAATFYSEDKDNVSFVINLDQESYTTAEDIGFTVNFEDSDTGEKPSGGSLQVAVDGGAYQEIITSGNSSSYYHVELDPIASTGSHTLSFLSPDLCGSFFDYSVYTTALFGLDDCTFEVSVTVVGDTPANPPSIVGDASCYPDESYAMTVSASHSAGLNVYYDIDWDSNGSIDERVPATGYVAAGVAQNISHTWSSTVSLKVRATDTSGAASAWTSYSAACAPDSTLSISANPVLVPANGSSVITWTSNEMDSCSVSGTNGDSWNGLTGSQTTSVLSDEETYTLSCINVVDQSFEASVTIRLVPKWNEF